MSRMVFVPSISVTNFSVSNMLRRNWENFAQWNTPYGQLITMKLRFEMLT
jgi:hypothetical protein